MGHPEVKWSIIIIIIIIIIVIVITQLWPTQLCCTSLKHGFL